MTSFSPLNFYTFAAARGEFLRPDVRALLAGASVGPFSRVTIWHDGMLQSVPDPKSAGIRKRLDALLFPEGYRARTRRNSSMPQECNPIGNVRREAPHVYVC
jgi:hypothetical protein